MNHKQLVQQMADMKAELDKYQAELTNLRSQISSYENVEVEVSAPATASATSSRRKMLKRMAIAGISGIGALGLAASVNPTHTVLAETPADNAIEAIGGGNGYGLRAQGGLAPLFLVGSGTGSPTSGDHTKGELFVDNSGNLYYCVANGTPGTWRQLSGGNTVGSYHSLPNPERFVDTRTTLGGTNSNPISRNNAATFQMTGVNGQTNNASLQVPSGATAIVGNITSVSPTGAGNVVLYPADAASAPATSSLNFPTNGVIGNNFTVGLSPSGQMKALARGAADYTVNLVIDVFGYYK